MSKDYLARACDVTKKPLTAYPGKMTAYIADRFQFQRGWRLLETGCGRGEFLRGFQEVGLEVVGVDMCHSSREFARDLDIQISIIGQEPLPFEDASVDVIFSKSLVEHLANPEILMSEVDRLLKPGGLVITMTPDWESNQKTFYDDLTHVRPYTFKTLESLYEQFSLDLITVEKFYQLPIVWKYPAMRYFCRFLSLAAPSRSSNKFLRFSKELMLLAVGRKNIRLEQSK